MKTVDAENNHFIACVHYPDDSFIISERREAIDVQVISGEFQAVLRVSPTEARELAESLLFFAKQLEGL